MKFTVSTASDKNGHNDYDIEINTLEDLENLQKDYAIPAKEHLWKGPSLIVDFNSKTIVIYDYFIE